MATIADRARGLLQGYERAVAALPELFAGAGEDSIAGTSAACAREVIRLTTEREQALASVTGVDLREGHQRDNATPDELRDKLYGAGLQIAALTAERDKLQRFKTWVHDFLDAHGVPHHPPGTHGEHGCRIGDRLDWLTGCQGQLAALRTAVAEALPILQEASWRNESPIVSRLVALCPPEPDTPTGG